MATRLLAAAIALLSVAAASASAGQAQFICNDHDQNLE
jgi:hypothetical protein